METMNWNYFTAISDHFNCWCEEVLNNLTEEFYTANEDWVMDYSGMYNSWQNRLYSRNKTPIDAAVIIQRAFKIYKIHG